LVQSGTVSTPAGDLSIDGTGQTVNRALIECATGIAMAMASETSVQMQMAIAGQQSMVIPLDMQIRIASIRRMPSR
jgi:hypothetical protein